MRWLCRGEDRFAVAEVAEGQSEGRIGSGVDVRDEVCPAGRSVGNPRLDAVLIVERGEKDVILPELSRLPWPGASISEDVLEQVRSRCGSVADPELRSVIVVRRVADDSIAMNGKFLEEN